MTPHIRTCRPESDHAAVRRMLSDQPAPPCTAQEFDAWYEEFPPTGKVWQWVAEDSSGQIVGYANTSVEDPESDPGQFEIFVVLEQKFQGCGIGAALLNVAEETARVAGAEHLRGTLQGGHPSASRFAHRHGYTIERYTIDSRLDLSDYDEQAAFPGVVVELERAGIRYETLASDHSDERLEKLYTLYTRVRPTFPGVDPGSPALPYERWRESLVSSYQDKWELVTIALAGERVVGITRMEEEGSPATLYTPHTSIDPDYRGRKVGLGLKLYATRIAKQRGAQYLTTNNDADNHPILAINRKMGYRPTAEWLFMGKTLTQAKG